MMRVAICLAAAVLACGADNPYREQLPQDLEKSFARSEEEVNIADCRNSESFLQDDDALDGSNIPYFESLLQEKEAHDLRYSQIRRNYEVFDPADILTFQETDSPYLGSLQQEEFNRLFQMAISESDEDPASVSARRWLRWWWRRRRGDGACDRTVRHSPRDTISQKFYNDHICLVRGRAPTDLTSFCRDFRRGVPLYQVMILSPKDIGRLRKDLTKHQNDFKRYQKHFLPKKAPPSTMHFYTDETYNFIECKKTGSTYKGKKLSGLYQAYIPRGTNGGIYEIYHGCPPVCSYHGFSAPGPC